MKKEAEFLEVLPENSNVIGFKFFKQYRKYCLMGLEYGAGGTVQHICKQHRKKGIPDEQAAQIIKAILLGIQHLHRNNLVHRDIKPSNVVVGTPEDMSTLKLVDFGLAVKYQAT